jgi:hypothetical protein
MMGVAFETTGAWLTATSRLGFHVRVFVKDRDAVFAHEIQEFTAGNAENLTRPPGRESAELVKPNHEGLLSEFRQGGGALTRRQLLRTVDLDSSHRTL